MRTLCKICGRKKIGSHNTYCRDCYNEYKRNFYKRHREKEIKRSSKYNKENPEKVALNMRKCRARRPEYYRSYMNERRKNNPEYFSFHDRRKRAMRRGAIKNTLNPLTIKEWEEIKQKQKGRCFYCREKTKNPQMEHKIPLSRNGRHDRKNIVASCGPCNNSKNNKTPKEFLKWQKLKMTS